MGLAHSYNSLVVFGDSLSDTGNLCGPCGSNPENELVDYDHLFCEMYLSGFTDGLLWTEYLAEHIGHLGFKPSDHGGHNFAIGGATSENLAEQVKACLARELVINPSTLVVLWVGGNDVKNYFKDNMTIPKHGDGPLTRRILRNLEKSIRQLAAKGAKSFLIPNLPPLDQAPLVKALLTMQNLFLPLYSSAPAGALTLSERIKTTIVHFNTQQKNLLARLKHDLDIEIHEIDVFELFSEAIAESDKNLFFYDGFHPSWFAHRLIARKAVQVITHDLKRTRASN